PPRPAAKVFASSGIDEEPFFARIRRIETAPLVAVNVWLDRPLGTMHAYEALLDCTIEWVFDRTKMHPKRSGRGHYYTLIASASWAPSDRTHAEILRASHESLALHYPAARSAEVLHASVVRHPDATFSARPGFRALRCPQRTPFPN